MKSNSTVVLDFDSSIHSLDAVLKASYRFTGQADIEITRVVDSYRCTIREAIQDSAYDIETEFRRAVLDEELRSRIRSDTEQVKNLILAFAFSGLVTADEINK